jgi:hypothetical protein
LRSIQYAGLDGQVRSGLAFGRRTGLVAGQNSTLGVDKNKQLWPKTIDIDEALI